MAVPTSPRIVHVDEVPERVGASYPEGMGEPCAGRRKRALGDAVGIRNFGVNLTTLEPGASTALRHWHTRQDELIYVLDGEVTLESDAGRTTHGPGSVIGFTAGATNAHRILNASDRPARVIEVGDRLPGDEVRYPDVDLVAHSVARWLFTKKNGDAY